MKVANKSVVNSGRDSMRRAVLGACVAAALAGTWMPLSSPVAWAQRAVGPGNADPTQGVYVRDSAIASDKFELGKRMEKLKEWPKSADVYQEILDKGDYQDKVVPTAWNEKQQPTRYASVRTAVQERLARWPADGLAVYRQRFEPAAMSALESAKADDYGALSGVFDHYFVTEAGKQAGLRLMAMYLEAGDFAGTVVIGDRLLEWHPTIAVERGMIAYRTAVAYQMLGNTTAAQKRLAELRTQDPNSTGTIAGKDVLLADSLAQWLVSTPVTPGVSAGTTAQADSYPMFGGGPSRGVVTSAKARPGVRVWKADFLGPIVQGLPQQNKDAVMAAMENARSSGNATGVIPAVDRGELFFNDGQRIFALHLESGVPLSGWSQTYGGTRNGQYTLPGAAPAVNPNDGGLSLGLFGAPRQFSVTVTEESVLAVMGQSDARMRQMAAMGMGVFPMQRGGVNAVAGGTQLVCLDRATGRERWRVDPATLPNNQGNPKMLCYSGSPLVVGEKVYVIARGGAAGVDDCNVLCYDANNGALNWMSYVASANGGNMNMGGMPSASSDAETMSHLAFASGRVFVLTNLGAMAAIDAYSGATAWLTIYPRDEARTMNRAAFMGGFGMGGMGAMGNADAVRPWEVNSVIVKDGKVFVLPTDGKDLIVYDAGTGDELKRIPRTVDLTNDATRLTMLLGVLSDDRLLVAGSDRILCMEWPEYNKKNPASRKLDYDHTIWVATVDDIKGRPFVTTETIYVPAGRALAMVSVQKGKVLQRFPSGGDAWPSDEGPGNVVVTGDHVLVANAKNVSVYTDREAVRVKYDLALKQDPGNVEARLVYAEQMFNARDLKEAMSAMDEAIKVLGGLKAMRPGVLRDRVFSDAVLFASRLGAEKTNDSITLAQELFDRAAAAAQTPSQQVNYRFARGTLHESIKEGAAAVGLYQQVLSDPEMRIITTAAGEESTGAVQAGKLAETKIKDLIRRIGPSVYDTFEKEAAAKLALLQTTPEAGKLLALAENYPNSKVAPRSMMLAAETYEKAGENRMATQTLRRLYYRYGTSYSKDEQPRLIEAMARNYLKVGSTSAALGRLQKGALASPAAELSAPLVGPDGKAILAASGQPARTLKEAADALALVAQRRSVELLPDVALPLPPTREDRVARKPLPKPFTGETAGDLMPGVTAILETPPDLSDFARYDRVLVSAGPKVLCLKPGSMTPQWTSAALTEGAASVLWVGNCAVVIGEAEIAMLDRESGATAWRVDVRSMPTVELVTAGGAGSGAAIVEPSAASAPEVDNDVVVFNGRRQIIRGGMVMIQPGIVDVGQGQVAQPAQPGAAAPNDGKERVLHVRPLSDRLIVSTTTGRVAALDQKDGHVIWQTRVSTGRAIAQTLATDDFTALRIQEGATVRLAVLDSYNGQQALTRTFSTSNANCPINCALGADGLLVWTTPQSMVAKDLFEPTDQPSWERPQQAGGYMGLTQPDQLIVANQQIYAVASAGGKVERRRNDGNISGPPLPTGVAAGDASVRLRQAGPRLYAVGNRSLLAVHLEDDTMTTSHTLQEVVSVASEVMLSRDYTILPGTTTGSPDKYALQCYSRALTKDEETGKSAESGLMVFRHEFSEPSKVKAFCAADGGVYYLAGDGTLHFLRGSRK